MQGGSTGIETTNYEANSNWDLVDSSWNVESDTNDSTITFSLRLKRKPLFFMLSVIFPIITLAILNLCVFLLPCECGERASYAITVFLAFAVFLTIISSSLPKNSESVAAISVFLVIQTICGTLITGIALALLRLCSFDERDEKVAIPRILIFLMRSLKCKSCSNSSKVVPKNDTKMPATEIEMDATESAMGASDFKLSDIQMPPQKRATERRMSDESSIGEVEYSWKEVVNFLDVVLFVIFAVILVASLLGCFVGAQNS
ncbi:hypothetical protein DPMN_070558 [Dreissena polymorpha]|uniref:Neurotransmitter-gated ion-channel transmembrane domain-containing protein n=1 Tax=Dreissena polymorpha TaxID=45954 RepID=A0A9D3Z6E6_DREPO|nr:hypothetical protein DPMN_070558 [Dreissena polymorpha]